ALSIKAIKAIKFKKNVTCSCFLSPCVPSQLQAMLGNPPTELQTQAAEVVVAVESHSLVGCQAVTTKTKTMIYTRHNNRTTFSIKSLSVHATHLADAAKLGKSDASNCTP